MATIREQELIDEIVVLNSQIANLQIELTLYKDVSLSVEGIIHHIDAHDSTIEDLKELSAVFKVKLAIARTIGSI